MFNDFYSLGQYLTLYFKDDYYLIGCLVGSGEISTWEINWKTKITKKLGFPPGQSLEFLCNLSNAGNFLKSVSNVSERSCILRNIGAVLHENSQFEPLSIKGSMNEFIFIERSTSADVSIIKPNIRKLL